MRLAGKTCLILLAAAALIAAGCGGNQQSTATTSGLGAASAAQTTVAASTGSTGKVDDDLVKIAQSFAALKSFRAVISAQVQGQQSVQSTVEYVAPDRYHLVSGTTEFISVGPDSYIKAGGQWTKAPGAGVAQTFNMNSVTDMLKDAPAYTKGGTETIDAKRCQDYVHTSTEGTATLCVGDNYLPVQFVGALNGTKTTIDYQDLNGNINIQPPV
jgi:hypothetical protein